MLWSAQMMLEHLGHEEAAADLMAAIEASLADPATRTRNLGGHADTATAADAVITRCRLGGLYTRSGVRSG
jgi:tartrate dehydrogenase/decarboxylase / D-malate dehydrogenase